MLDWVGLKIFNFFNFLFGFFSLKPILLVIKISQNQYRMSHNLDDSMSITIFQKKKHKIFDKAITSVASLIVLVTM
jgi:hypothetical protein